MAEIGKNNKTNFEHFEAKTQKTAQRTWLKFIKENQNILRLKNKRLQKQRG